MDMVLVDFEAIMEVVLVFVALGAMFSLQERRKPE